MLLTQKYIAMSAVLIVAQRLSLHFFDYFVQKPCDEWPFCHTLRFVDFLNDRGVEQGLARWAHNPKVGGSNPSPAIFFCVAV